MRTFGLVCWSFACGMAMTATVISGVSPTQMLFALAGLLVLWAGGVAFIREVR